MAYLYSFKEQHAAILAYLNNVLLWAIYVFYQTVMSFLLKLSLNHFSVINRF